jgi:hypothetical protein
VPSDTVAVTVYRPAGADSVPWVSPVLRSMVSDAGRPVAAYDSRLPSLSLPVSCNATIAFRTLVWFGTAASVGGRLTGLPDEPTSKMESAEVSLT